MPASDDLTARLWKALRSDMTVMLGLAGGEQGHARPMTAQIEERDHGPLWFFTTRDNELVQKLQGGTKDAAAQFVSKGHDLWASINGTLAEDTDPAVVDRLWNSHVAAWYEQGRNDPRVALLRFDPREAEIWLDASSIVAGVMVALGLGDARENAQDKVATVRL